ncbi:MAG: sensor histidine kinase [Actinomycetota bacterium]
MARKLPRNSALPPSDSSRFQPLAYLTIGLAAMAFAFAVTRDTAALSGPAWRLTPWILAVAIADFGAIQVTKGLQLTFGYPLLLALAFLFGPAAAGIVALTGSLDRRELKREITVLHALFNRSQIALSVMAASTIFHLAGGDRSLWPAVLAPAALALLTDGCVNALFAGLGARFQHNASWSVFQGWVALGRPIYFIMTYSLYGLSAVLFREFYDLYGLWAFVAFVIPLTLGHEVFLHAQRLRLANSELKSKEVALEAVSRSIVDERRDERSRVAADLHDEVLQPLHHVHLMGEVLRHDLATGRLFDLENDLPDLLRATEAAADSIRGMIKDLRSSSVGRGGLTPTVGLLIEEVSVNSAIKFESTLGDVGGSAQTQLLVYQVAREAILNSVRHSRAKSVVVDLRRVEHRIRLTITDDGVGFDSDNVDKARHFGLQLIRERVEMAGGNVSINSKIGGGTEVLAEFPPEVPF